MGASSLKKKITVNTIIHIILILLAVICLFPIVLVLINSFKENSEIVRNPLSLPDIIHLENYIQAWTTGKFAKGFLNSVKLTGCTVLIVLFSSTLAGYVLSGKRIKGSGAIYMPLAIFLMRTFFLNVPKELEEAARIDGANTRQVIWSVMRPVVSPGMITVSILIGLQSWNEYLITSTFLQGEKNFTATLGFLSMNGSYGSNMSVLMASAMILIVPIIIFFLLTQRKFIDGMVSGAVKG